MKTIIISLIIFLAKISAQEWDVQNSGTSSTLRDVIYLDNQNGIVVGDNSTILKTSDAGFNWKNIISPITNILFKKVYQIDKVNILIIGSKGTVLKSIDMGNTWSIQLHDTSYDFLNIYFINNSTGWICGNLTNYDFGGVIFRTTDGGITWIKQLETLNNPNLPGYRIDDLFFYKNNTGITLANGSIDPLGPTFILKTEDSGNNWFLYGKTESDLVSQFSKTSKDTIWAGRFGLEVSVDGGKSWKNSGFNFIIQNSIVSYEPIVYDIVQETGKKGYLITLDFNENKRRLFYAENIFTGLYSVKIPDNSKPLALTISQNNFLCMVGEKGLILKSRWIYTNIKNAINNDFQKI